MVTTILNSHRITLASFINLTTNTGRALHPIRRIQHTNETNGRAQEPRMDAKGNVGAGAHHIFE